MVQPGAYRLHSRFSHAGYYADGNSLIAIVDDSVGAGPVNIVADDVANWEIRDLEIGADCIHAAGQDFPLPDVPRYDSSLQIPANTDPAQFKANLTACRDHLIRIAPQESLAFLLDEPTVSPATCNFENALRSRFAEAIGLLRTGQIADGARLIKGLGRGLTPQGDDFIAGLLFALHVRGRLFGEPARHEIGGISAAANSENPFSQAMFDCAARGRAYERLKNLIQSLFAADTGLVEARAKELMSIGATSGADTATGLFLGLELPRIRSGRSADRPNRARI